MSHTSTVALARVSSLRIPRCDELSDDADRFRKQAEEARQQAEKSISPVDKEAWLRVAVEWLKLAQSVDDRRKLARDQD